MKLVAVRILGRLLSILRSRSIPPGEAPRRILLLRADRLGDAIITIPLIRHLRSRFPEVDIDVLASESNREFCETIPEIARVFPTPDGLIERVRTIRLLRGRDYDYTINCRLNRTTLPGVLAGLVTPTGLTVGRSTSSSQSIYDLTTPIDGREHFATQTLALATPLTGGSDSPDWHLEVDKRAAETITERLGSGAGEGILLVNLSAGHPRRRLSEELVSRILEWGDEEGWLLAAVFMPEDREIAERLKREHHLLELLGTLPMSELVEAVRAADILITPDTSTTHLATAVGTRAIVCFASDGNPAGWGPLSPGSVSLKPVSPENAGGVTFEQIEPHLPGRSDLSGSDTPR